MAYSTIASTERDVDSPLTVSFIGKMIDNPEGIATAESGATKIVPAAMEQHSAGTTYIIGSDEAESADYTSGVYVRVKSFVVWRAGTLTVKFEAKSPNANTRARIYKNGAAFGTERSPIGTYTEWSENLTFAAGDTVEVWLKGFTSAFIRQFYLQSLSPDTTSRVNL